MRNELLFDDALIEGNNIAYFRQVVQEIDEGTTSFRASTNELTLLPLLEYNDEASTFAVCADSLTEKKIAKLNHEKFLDKGGTNELLKEMHEKSKLLIQNKGTIYFTSFGLSRDLGARARVGGDAIYDPTKERAAYFMSRYIKEPSFATVVCRNNMDTGGSVQKIIAILSGRYCYVPQGTLLKIIDNIDASLGAVKCNGWSVSNNLTRILLEFPDKAAEVAKTYSLPNTVIPGLMLETSDTGDCSITAVGTWRLAGKRYASYGNRYSRKHSGEVDIENVMSKIEKTIFGKYTVLPARLCELMLVDMKFPASAINNVLATARHTVALSKRTVKYLAETLGNELDPGAKYTAYDIAMLLLDLPARVESNNNETREEVQKLCYNALFEDFVAADLPPASTATTITVAP